MNIRNLKDQPLDEIQVKKAGRQIKGFLIGLLKVVIIIGISYYIRTADHDHCKFIFYGK
jgi:hypothetical protein